MTSQSFSPSRRAVLSGALSGAVAFAGGQLLRPGIARASADPLAIIHARINDYRAAHGRPRLSIEHRLTAVAQRWSGIMRDRGAISHNPHYVAEYGWDVQANGEIVASAWGEGSDEAHAHRVVDAWIGSAAHRAVMLGDYTDIGVGWATAGPGQRLFATADFVRADLPGPGQEAVGLSRELIGDRAAPRAVLVRSDVAADGLAATGLVTTDTPLFLTRPGQALPDTLVAELGRALAPGATVHIVGGGLPGVIDDQVRRLGATPQRLHGRDRYETAAAVAAEVGRLRGTPFRQFLTGGEGWADAAAAGAVAATYGLPILLTPRDSLHPAAERGMGFHSNADRVTVGGRAVVGDAVVGRAGGWRLAGGDRAGTGARLLLEVWTRTARAGDHLLVTPGWTGDGWATALAHSTYAARHAAPILYAAHDGVPPAIRSALQEAGYGPGAPATLRFARHVGDQARAAFTAAAT